MIFANKFNWTRHWLHLACIALAATGLACNQPKGERGDNTANSSVANSATTTTRSTETMAAPKANPVVIMETSKGTIKIELDAANAPKSTENFLRYTDEGFYNGTIFHRVIPGFMVQGGGFTPDMDQKRTHEQIKNEATNGLKNTRGTLAMARTNVVDSATSQFFINVADNTFLNHRSATPDGYGYAVFGKVIEGMDVVDKIVAVKTTSVGGYDDVPVEPVTIKSAKRQ